MAAEQSSGSESISGWNYFDEVRVDRCRVAGIDLLTNRPEIFCSNILQHLFFHHTVGEESAIVSFNIGVKLKEGDLGMFLLVGERKGCGGTYM